jgi:hypothetical protein
MTIGADAYANGSISGPTIGGKAYVPAGASVSPAPAGGIVHGPVSFPPPCDCAANQLIPITAMVQAHATKNDNAAIGLDPKVLASPGGPTRLDLPCGAYYLTSVTGPVTIWAHGQTALYIGGNVTSGSTLAFGVDPTGAFDVFIEGTLSESSGLTIGSPNYPALTRTYVGSTSGMNFSDAANIAGEIYAAYGPVDWSAGTDAYGSVFAGNFLGTSDVKIHYDLAVLQQGNSCPTSGGGGPADAGGGGASCSSCRDCLNQACNAGKCGGCSTSADCCAPLICVGGSCEPALK